MILIFDTETTGLISKNSENLPHIIQLSWIIYNTTNKQYAENDFILKIPIKIPQESTRIHGITNKISKSGYKFSEIINIFLEDVRKCDRLVGHNLNFDLNMLEIELSRIGQWDDIDLIFSKDVYDTMIESVNICKIKSDHGNKFPKLSEVYIHFFGQMFENAHNAMEDVHATFKVYQKLTE